MRSLLIVSFLCVSLVGGIQGQIRTAVDRLVESRMIGEATQASTVSTDRMTIARNMSGSKGPGAVRLRPGGPLTATNVTLRELIDYAYQRHAFDKREVTGGPEWVDAERFDVVAPLPGDLAVAPDGAMHETWSLVRRLLADRFALDLHEERRERPIYALMTVADGGLGPQLRRTDIDCGIVMKEPRPAIGPSGPPCGMKTPPGRLFANTIAMPTLATLLSQYVDRPVVDRTALSGRFDVVLEATEITAPPNYQPGPSDLALPPASGPSIFVAVREQLGLVLEPQMGPISVIVVDRATRPAAR